MVEFKDLRKINNYLWEIPVGYKSGMNVPARFYASESMLEKILTDSSLNQLINVSCLPGIYKYALAMPDIHEGYGFPIGGVAAFPANDGVISPGGVGYDINCGVRLLASQHTYPEIKTKILELANQIQRDVPSGVGRGGILKLNQKQLNEVLKKGARWAVENGYGQMADLMYLEENGEFKVANPDLVSDQAKKRGADQIGTLGAGNHFLEIQKVEEVFDEFIANALGLKKDALTIMIHTGSRGLGHQICTDYVRILDASIQRYKISIPDRELACVPFKTLEGQNYFQAMAAGANFAWCNRQLIMHRIRTAWQRILGDNDLTIIYDVAHNIAKLENYDGKDYLIHRKGATRCFGPNSKELPAKYQKIGQPVLIPGSMGTASYVLIGTQNAMAQTFGSTCHGAGRVMSRNQAIRELDYQRLRDKLEKEGIILRGGSKKGLLEEAPEAYKNVDEVVEVVDKAEIAKKVVKLKPLAVIKG